MKVAVIDDSVCIQSALQSSIERDIPGAEVETFWGLEYAKPEDYDVLIVDNAGIGDANYKNGVEFLCDYASVSHAPQLIIHFTGLCDRSDRERLDDCYGVNIVDKVDGCAPVIDLIKGWAGIKDQENT